MLNEILSSSRFKSLLWRAAMMGIATFLSVLANNLGGLDIGGEATVVLGLILGELSKALNNRYGLKK